MSSTAFPGFERLGEGGFLRKAQGEAPADQPECVLLFSWMNGAPKHIEKYTDAYAQHYPQSSLVLVQSSTGIFAQGQKENERQLQPVATWLKQSGLLKQKDSRLLVHIMSNGGGIRATNVARILQKMDAKPPAKPSRDAPPRQPVEAALPARAYVLDSMPGKATLHGFINAFTAHLAKRPWWAKIPYILFLVPLHYTLILFNLLRGRLDPISLNSKRMLDPSLYKQQAPRAFLYSDADKLIDAPHVEEAIADAKRMGGKVDAVLFRRSPHVSHMRTNPERYWKAIRDAYNSG